MPEYLRALIVVLILAGIAFKLLRQPASKFMSLQDFARRRYLWFGFTVLAFIAHSFWVYAFVTAIVLVTSLGREANRLALYFLLLFLIPPASVQIPGLGLINFLFDLDHVRLLALCILLPTYIILKNRPESGSFGRGWPDKLITAYLIMVVAMSLRDYNITGILRLIFALAIDVFLPYYVASRALNNVRLFRDSLFSFVMAATVLGLVGMFELWRHWQLYSAVLGALGVQWDYSGYLGRAGSLRAMATTGNSIALGYVMAIAISFYLFLKQDITHINSKRIIGLVLVAGLFSTLSRGPWVGAVAILVTYTAMADSPLRRLTTLAFFCVAAVAILSMLPGGERTADILPWVGNTDAGSITYREQLIKNAWIVIQQHPWLGSVNYLMAPEMEALRQGQGIIDVVNTYLGIALKYGIVGLGLFLAFFASVLLGIRKGMKGIPRDDETYRLGQSLFATLVGILIIILTVSGITIIPIVYWSVAGMGVAYAEMLRRQPT